MDLYSTYRVSSRGGEGGKLPPKQEGRRERGGGGGEGERGEGGTGGREMWSLIDEGSNIIRWGC